MMSSYQVEEPQLLTANSNSLMGTKETVGNTVGNHTGNKAGTSHDVLLDDISKSRERRMSLRRRSSKASSNYPMVSSTQLEELRALVDDDSDYDNGKRKAFAEKDLSHRSTPFTDKSMRRRSINLPMMSSYQVEELQELTVASNNSNSLIGMKKTEGDAVGSHTDYKTGTSHGSFRSKYEKKSFEDYQYQFLEMSRPLRRRSLKGSSSPTIVSNQSIDQFSFEDSLHTVDEIDLNVQKKMPVHTIEYPGKLWRIPSTDSLTTAIAMKRISPLSKRDSRSTSPASCLSSLTQGPVSRKTKKNRFTREWIVLVNRFLLPLSMVVALVISYRRTGEGSRKNDVYPEQISSNLNQLNLLEFRDLLFSEVGSEVEAIAENRSKSRRQSESVGTQMHGQYLWDHLVHHGWIVSEYFSTSSRQKLKNLRVSSAAPSDGYSQQKEKHFDSLVFPFLICSNSHIQSGAHRMNSIMSLLHAHDQDAIVISNTPEQSCYHISSPMPTAKLIASSRLKEYDIIPFTDIMKIGQGTMEHVTRDYWRLPTQERRMQALELGDTSFEWERIIHITLAAGKKSLKEGEVIAKGNEILQDIKEMAREGASDRRKMTEGKKNRSQHTLSITNAFSLTSVISTGVDQQREDEVADGRVDLWYRSLKHGIEADHTCDRMFASLLLKAQYKNKGFDLILNPQNETVLHSTESSENIDDSSASNPHCVTSLIMALSLHPSVIYIEIAVPTTPDDFESHWITQSDGISKRRPFFDLGLKGKGQIISVADSGLDMNSRFFSPVSQRVFNVSRQDKLYSNSYCSC